MESVHIKVCIGSIDVLCYVHEVVYKILSGGCLCVPAHLMKAWLSLSTDIGRWPAMCLDLIIHMPIIAPTALALKDMYLVALPKWYLSTLDGAVFSLLYISVATLTFRSIADPSVNILISGRLSASFCIAVSLSCRFYDLVVSCNLFIIQ